MNFYKSNEINEIKNEIKSYTIEKIKERLDNENIPEYFKEFFLTLINSDDSVKDVVKKLKDSDNSVGKCFQ